MSQVALKIQRAHHHPSIQTGHPVEAIRLVAPAAFATPTGWTVFHDFVVDTGAPVSLLPADIWSSIQYRTLGRTSVGGLSTRPECKIPAILAEVHCLLSDNSGLLGPIKMFAYLADTDEAPALLGMSGFIQHGRVQIHLANHDAYIEM